MKKQMKDLIFAHLDDSATDEEVQQLFEWIQADRENAKEFARQALLHANLRRQLAGEFLAKKSTAEKPITEKPGSSFDAPILSPATTSRSRKSFGKPARTNDQKRRNVAVRGIAAAVAALAASILLALGASFWFTQTPNGSSVAVAPNNSDQENDALPSTTVADTPNVLPFVAIVGQVNAKWNEEAEAPVVDTPMSKRELNLASGVAKLRFKNGVLASLEGPARFEFKSPLELKLYSGRIATVVPPNVKGFTVTTPTATVVDLGTAFAVDVSQDGTTDVQLLDGVVDVSTSDLDEPKRLQPGDAVNVSTDGIVDQPEFQQHRFTGLWSATFGVTKTLGDCSVGTPWDDAELPNSSPNPVEVIAESMFKLSGSTHVDISSPGTYRSAAELSEDQIGFGTQVRSYLLNFIPQPTDFDIGGSTARTVGEVTFDRPVLGLIVLDESLRESDVDFANDSADKLHYGAANRQIEFVPDAQLGESVTLGKDRRTVTFNFNSRGRSPDQIRVLVDHTSPFTDKN